MQKQILIVDDSEVFTGTVLNRLESQGYENITSAPNGTDGIERVKKDNPDLIVLDVVLPDINGFDVCKKIKEFVNDNLKIIIVTGEEDMIDAGRAREAGADAFAVKTSDNSPLFQSIESLLGE